MDKIPSASAKVMPSNKQIIGLAVILIVAILIGGWLYVESVRNDLEAKIQTLSAQNNATKTQVEQNAVESGDAANPAVVPPVDASRTGWRTFVSAANGYQIDLPPGYRLNDTGTHAYVVAEPVSAENALPFMSIEVAPLSAKASYANQKGHLAVSDTNVFWMSLWEDMEWQPFDQVAASFKTL